MCTWKFISCLCCPSITQDGFGRFFMAICILEAQREELDIMSLYKLHGLNALAVTATGALPCMKSMSALCNASVVYVAGFLSPWTNELSVLPFTIMVIYFFTISTVSYNI